MKRAAVVVLLLLAGAYLTYSFAFYDDDDAPSVSTADWVSGLCSAWLERQAELRSIPPSPPAESGSPDERKARAREVWAARQHANEGVAAKLQLLPAPKEAAPFLEALVAFLQADATKLESGLEDIDRLYASEASLAKWSLELQELQDYRFSEVAAASAALPGLERARLAALECAGVSAFAPGSSAKTVFVEELLNYVQSTSPFGRDLDWLSIRARFREAGGRARTSADLYPMVRDLLRSLGDDAARFIRPDELSDLRTPSPATVPATSAPVPQAAPVGLAFRGLGYLSLPAAISADMTGAQLYAASAHRIIEDIVQSPGACGWIIDLRRSTGGYMYTLLAAIGPILGDGDAGWFLQGATRSRWSYLNGAARLEGQTLVNVAGAPRLSTLPPAAILTSRETRGSGEGIVISFRGRPDSRVFGTETAGRTLVATGRPLGDGSAITISGAYMVDRTSRIYSEPIRPDEFIETSALSDFSVDTLAADAVVGAAATWLLSHPACSR